MNSRMSSIFRLIGQTSLIIGISIFMFPSSAAAQDFVGSEACKDCHPENYRDWSASGHPYKLMKGEEARFRPIPLPYGVNWDDVSYVIGGYKWKSRYIDQDGYIITVTEDANGNTVDGQNQYNYLTGEWVDYHPGEANLPYTCGSCHTTNWVPNPDPTDLTGNQDMLPGMHGKFDVGGVHCEQCHGNGTAFPPNGMIKDTSAEACGVCHYRDSPPGSEVNTIPASGGFIKHHEQYNEHLAGPHANLDCVSCHDPHKRGEFSIKEGRDCTNCHVAIAQSFATTGMASYGVECKDCHMPYASKSANQLGPFEGDVQTHIFYINTDADGDTFTPEGDFVALNDEGKAAVTLDFACVRCHETAELTELSRFAKNFHGVERDDNEELLDELHYVGLNPGLTGNWWGGASRDGEGFLIDFSYANGTLVIVSSFYTYDSMGNQTWLIGAGLANDGTSATVSLTIPEGAMWGADFDPNDLPDPKTPWGTAEFTFPNCDEGSVILKPNDAMKARGFSDYTYESLTRDITVSGIQCPTFNNIPQ